MADNAAGNRAYTSEQAAKLDKRAGTEELAFHFGLTTWAAGFENQSERGRQATDPNGVFELWSQANIAIARDHTSCRKPIKIGDSCTMPLGSLEATLTKDDQGLHYDVHRLYPDGGSASFKFANDDQPWRIDLKQPGQEELHLKFTHQGKKLED